mmetsp:Transcript_139397/g.445821  ORF Transcript_139397/g.445821 Transcript_139397/m.445821 type:complete len:224 (-) Transcript_139397:1130-1801(-)
MSVAACMPWPPAASPVPSSATRAVRSSKGLPPDRTNSARWVPLTELRRVRCIGSWMCGSPSSSSLRQSPLPTAPPGSRAFLRPLPTPLLPCMPFSARARRCQGRPWARSWTRPPGWSSRGQPRHRLCRSGAHLRARPPTRARAPRLRPLAGRARAPCRRCRCWTSAAWVPACHCDRRPRPPRRTLRPLLHLTPLPPPPRQKSMVLRAGVLVCWMGQASARRSQ